MPDAPSPLVLTGQVVGGLLAGAALAVLGCYAHLVVIGSARVPFGLLLALALTTSAGLLLRALPTPPAAALAVVASWVVVVLVASVERREGDLVLVQNGRGLGFLVGGLVVLVVTVVVPAARVRRPAVRVGS